MSDELGSVLDSVWSEVSDELRRALDVVAAASAPIIEHELLLMDKALIVATFKRDLLRAELTRRT